MFDNINEVTEVRLRDVKASPSANSPNDGGWNDERNARWATKKLTCKPFIYGRNENEVNATFGENIDVGWNGAYNKEAMFSIDGYLFKLADERPVSYDDSEQSGGPNVNLLPAQKFVAGLVNAGTEYSISSDMERFMFADYCPRGKEITDTFKQLWLDACSDGSIIGFVRNSCADSYLAQLTIDTASTPQTVSYGNTVIVVDNTIDYTGVPNSLRYLDPNVSDPEPRTAPVAYLNYSDGEVIRADIYYPVKVRSNKRYVANSGTYETVYKIYFTDVFGIEYIYDNLRSSTHIYPYTSNLFTNMDSNDPLNSVSFTDCKLTTIPQNTYDFMKLYDTTVSPIVRNSFSTDVQDFKTPGFPNILTSVFDYKTISDLLSNLPDNVPSDTIPNIQNTLGYYCIKQDSLLSQLCLKVTNSSSPSGVSIPIVFMTTNGAVCPLGFITNGYTSNRYPAEGYLHFIKRLYVLKEHPSYSFDSPTEAEISAVTTQQLVSWTDTAEIPVNDGSSSRVSMSFNLFFQTYLYPCICLYFDLAYNSLMDNAVYAAGTNASTMKSSMCGRSLLSIPDVADKDTTANLPYTYTGYTNNSGTLVPSSITSTIEYHKDYTSDYINLRTDTLMPESEPYMGNYSVREKFDWSSAASYNYFEDPINLLKRCMPRTNNNDAELAVSTLTDSSATVFYTINGTSLRQETIDATPRLIRLDDILFPTTSVRVMGSDTTKAIARYAFVAYLYTGIQWMFNGVGIYTSFGNGIGYNYDIDTWTVSLPYVATLRKDSLGYLSGKDYLTGNYGGLQFKFYLNRGSMSDDDLLLFNYLGSTTPRILDYDYETFNGRINYTDEDVKTLREAFIHVSKIYDNENHELGYILDELKSKMNNIQSQIDVDTGDLSGRITALEEELNDNGGIADVVQELATAVLTDDTGLEDRVSAIETVLDTADTGLIDRVDVIENQINDPDTGILADISDINDELETAVKLLDSGKLSAEDDSESDITYEIYGTSLEATNNKCIIYGYGATDSDITYATTPLAGKGIYSIEVKNGVASLQGEIFGFAFNDLHISSTVEEMSDTFCGYGAVRRGAKFMVIDEGAGNMAVSGASFAFAFTAATNLESLVIPSTLGFVTIDGAPNLRRLIVHTYGISYISNCPELRELYLAGGIRGIQDNVFVGDTSLADIVYRGTTTEWQANTTGTDWDVTEVDSSNVPIKWLEHIYCLDGSLVRDPDTGTWSVLPL